MMAKKEENANSAIADLANRTARSSIAVIDTVSSRGGFRGEELSTIGQLRDQCVQIVAMCEAEQKTFYGSRNIDLKLSRKQYFLPI